MFRKLEMLLTYFLKLVRYRDKRLPFDPTQDDDALSGVEVLST